MGPFVVKRSIGCVRLHLAKSLQQLLRSPERARAHFPLNRPVKRSRFCRTITGVA